jgi:sigma-E factor negative regulatory protein RseA
MKDEILEQLSALVDDELSDLERPLLLGRLQRDASLRERMGRYQLISEVMRGTENASALGIADRVQAAIQQDTPSGEPRSPLAPAAGWRKPLAGVAIAASVAVVAVLTVTGVEQSADRSGGSQVAVADKSAVAVVQEDAAEERWDRIEPRINKRLSGYLVNHSEYAASRSAQGVMPYARIVGYEPDR